MELPHPPRLSLANLPTPLQPLTRISAELGGPQIWVKRDDLTGSHLSGNKVRKLEFVLAEAQHQGCDTLITAGGVQSNHCRATALLGAQLGMKVHLLLRGEPEPVPDGNLLLDLLAGADISYFPAAGFNRKLPERFQLLEQQYRELGRQAFSIPIGASDGIGVWGYLSCCQELQQDFMRVGIQPEWIVSATGSGGTQAGLVLGNHCLNLGTQVLGFAVCDDAAYFENKVHGDIRAWNNRYLPEQDFSQLVVNTNDHYIGPGYGKATEEVFETIKWVASTEGLVLDPVYSGKAFHGLASEIRNGSFKGVKDIVFVHTGGVFGLFPQRQDIPFPS